MCTVQSPQCTLLDQNQAFQRTMLHRHGWPYSPSYQVAHIFNRYSHLAAHKQTNKKTFQCQKPSTHYKDKVYIKLIQFCNKKYESTGWPDWKRVLPNVSPLMGKTYLITTHHILYEPFYFKFCLSIQQESFFRLGQVCLLCWLLFSQNIQTKQKS